MKKALFIAAIVLTAANVKAQSKKSTPVKADSTLQYVIVMSPEQLQSLKNFISNPSYFTTEGGAAFWNNQIAPLIRPFKAPVPADSANKK